MQVKNYECKFITFALKYLKIESNNLKPKITAIAITFNEEENVKRYVQSLSFVDEIIFIDSFSTDNTVQIAKDCGVIVFQEEFDTILNQKNFALSKASNDWVVFFNLNEVVNLLLEKEILMNLAAKNEYLAYSINRNFFFFGKQIKYGNWQSDKALKVFNKSIYCFDTGLLMNVKVKKLNEKINHYAYKNFESYNEKLNKLSKLEAKELYSKNKRPNVYHFFVLPNLYFLKQYILKLGFLDGKEGFILTYLHSFAIFKRYLQLWLLYRKVE